MLFIKIKNTFLHDILERHINSGYNCVSVAGRLYRTFEGGIRIEISVFPSIGTVQDIIIGTLNPDRTCIAVISKTDHITCHAPVRIGSCIILLQPDPSDIGVIFVIFINLVKLLRRLIINSFCKNLVLAARPFFDQIVYHTSLYTETLL